MKDQTGKFILEQLHLELQNHPLITLKTEQVVIDLLTTAHHATDIQDHYQFNRCLAFMFGMKKRLRSIHIWLKNVVLANGGIGQLYLHTTNPDSTVGDGIALAKRAGAEIINLEYVQFHPTSLYSKNNPRCYLLSEALRGEGAILLDHKLQPFMEKYHPLGCLAPRDVVARAIKRNYGRKKM